MASSSWATSRRLASAARVTGTEAPRRCATWTPGPCRSIRTCARGYARSTASEILGRSPNGPLELRLSAVGPIRGLAFGAFGEISEEARTLLCYAADATAARTWVADGATSEEHAAALLKNRLYRRWGIKTAREYARIKIDGLRLVGGNPDFTNPPGHGDDDARFYDRQQAYVHARGG